MKVEGEVTVRFGLRFGLRFELDDTLTRFHTHDHQPTTSGFKIWNTNTWSRTQLGYVMDHTPVIPPPHHLTTSPPHAPPHHPTRYMRDALTIIALLWLAFCTLFIFVWAVRAQDNDLILTIAMNLSVNFCFGEIITNPATVS